MAGQYSSTVARRFEIIFQGLFMTIAPYGIYLALLWVLLVVTGAMTSFTDIRERKIRNIHLIVASLAGIFLHVWAVMAHIIEPVPLLVNVAAAALGAFLLFVNNIWRPGDAKLFMVYALLMPSHIYERSAPLPCLAHFINTFLAGMVFLFPMIFDGVVSHFRDIFRAVCSLKTVQNLIYSFEITTVISWAIFPLFGFFRIPSGNPLVICIIFFIYRGVFALNPSGKLFKCFVYTFALGGLLFQFFSSYTIFSADAAGRFLLRMIPLTIFSQIVNELSEHMKEIKSRVPFAPFLFIGCLLCYGPFLFWLISLMRR